MNDLISYAAMGLMAFVIVLLGIVVNQRSRMKRFEAKVGLSGVGLTVELHELVKKEVARVSLASLGRLARVDRELINFWERGKLLSAEDSARRLELIKDQVAEVQKIFRSAPIEDKYQLALQLRDLYWKFLEYGRRNYASGEGYQRIRRQVLEGLKEIEQIGEPDSSS